MDCCAEELRNPSRLLKERIASQRGGVFNPPPQADLREASNPVGSNHRSLQGFEIGGGGGCSRFWPSQGLWGGVAAGLASLPLLLGPANFF